jgi:hypothetical protein
MGREENGVDDKPSARVVEQRIRNRVIEYLELAASLDEQTQYERAAPIAHVPYEVIEQWADNFPREPRPDADLLSVYSTAEVAAIREVNAAWEAAAALPDNFPSLELAQALPEWATLRRVAEAALGVFMRRGRMPEDREVS